MLQFRRFLPFESRAPRVSPSPALWRVGIVAWLGKFPVLERRRTQFGLWWGARTPRERRLLIALGGTAALVLLIVGIYRPLSDVRSRALADIRTYEVLAAQLRIAGPDLARLRAIDRAASQDAVTRTASTFGVAVARVETGEGVIRVSLQDADFTKMVQWLVQLESTSTLRISDVRIDRQARPGIVNAQIGLSS